MNVDQWQQMAAAFATAAADTSADRLCAACMEALGVDGAGITLMDGNQFGPLGVTGHGATALEELQFTLGEGPCHDAFRSGQPVHVTHFDDDAPSRWAPFAELAERTGVGAVFAYPMISDGARLGVLTLYQRESGDLNAEQHDMCEAMADVLALTVIALQLAAPAGTLSPSIDSAARFRAEIHQASGMVAGQLGVPPADALVRIRAHAYAADRSVGSVAADIVARRLRLDDDRNDLSGVVDQ
ncbi:MAG: hypothetical protein JWM34_1639 [Ilumatobacteraceae bacterium]|nr:hypothetical protein [Ilumatobacteraceae bacterium]